LLLGHSKYALKEKHILDWEKKVRLHTVCPSHNADAEHGSTKRITLVSTQPATVYVKTGKKVGHPFKKDEIAKSNTKINQFFTLPRL
jgi:hypothetical protein